MTIGTAISAIAVVGNGVTTQFGYPFLIPFASDAVVAVGPLGGPLTVLTPTQFSISGLGNPAGGTVTYPLSGSPISGGQFVAIGRFLPMVQTTAISSQGPTFAAIESALDYQMMVSQQLLTAIQDLQLEITGISASTTIQQVQSLASIAALRAYAGPGTLPAWVQGYYTIADGGEGWFAYNPNDSTSPDNGGTIVVDATGRRWDRSLQGQPPTLRQFGAKGDSTTDDTASVQSALNLRAHVRATAGLYRVQPLTLPGGTWLEGDGPGDALMLPVAPAETILASEASVASIGDFAVSGMGFLGTSSSPKGIAISMTGSSATGTLTNVSIQNCDFSGFTTSVYAHFCEASQFRDLYSFVCTAPYVSDANSAVVWGGCTADNVVGHAGNTAYAFTVENTLLFGGVQIQGCQSVNQAGGIIGTSASRVVVAGFQSFSASLTAVSLFGCSNWEIFGTQLTPLTTAVVGFSSDTTSSNVTFANSNVTGAQAGIFVGGSGVSVNGNVLQGNLLDIGVVGTGSLRINISGNICRSATSSASILEFPGSDYTLAIGNQVTGAIALVGAHSSSTSYNATIT